LKGAESLPRLQKTASELRQQSRVDFAGIEKTFEEYPWTRKKPLQLNLVPIPKPEAT
jgi:hypothetical protein